MPKMILGSNNNGNRRIKTSKEKSANKMEIQERFWQ
jgi:hypothetical protein